MSDTEMTNDSDNDAPTQALTDNDSDHEYDPSDAPTQALTQNIEGVGDNGDDDNFETQAYQPETQYQDENGVDDATQALSGVQYTLQST